MSRQALDKDRDLADKLALISSKEKELEKIGKEFEQLTLIDADKSRDLKTLQGELDMERENSQSSISLGSDGSPSEKCVEQIGDHLDRLQNVLQERKTALLAQKDQFEKQLSDAKKTLALEGEQFRTKIEELESDRNALR